jgi:hypothetical protein
MANHRMSFTGKKCIFETIKKGGLGAPDEFSNLKNAQDLD